jgi:methyl-accepting chemotaxis protein
MKTEKNNRRWRNFLIRPDFQLRLALVHIWFVVLVVIVLAVALLVPLYFDIHGSDDLWARYVTAELLLRLLNRLGIVVLLIAVVSAAYHIVFSHRLCGPLVNMGHTFESVGKGNLTRKVRLRRKDFLQEEAAHINGMLSALEMRIGDLKDNQEKASSVVEQLAEGDPEGQLRELVRRNQVLLDQWIVNLPCKEDRSQG